MRKIAEFKNDAIGKMARVFKDSENDEYIVKFWIEGGYMPNADYFTSDKQDALNTAKASIWLLQQG